MKHALLILAPLLLLLAACSSDTASHSFVLTKQSRESQDWGRYLPEMYDGLMACLAAHPSQPAYATDATPQNHGMILVRMRGADGSLQECSTGTGGNPAPKLSATATQRIRGPAFTPASMAEPFMRCGTPQPVLNDLGRLLGWLTYYTPDCPPPALAAESGWRAFGNEPYWTLRITGEDVVFDRLGEVPQRYPVKPADSSGNRMAWRLDSYDNIARDRLDVAITEASCGDTMAARQYPYRAEVTFQGRTYRGCAEKTAAIP